MQPTLNNPSGPVVPLPVMAVADVQDSLLVAMHDLRNNAVLHCVSRFRRHHRLST